VYMRKLVTYVRVEVRHWVDGLVAFCALPCEVGLILILSSWYEAELVWLDLRPINFDFFLEDEYLLLK